LSAAPNRVFRTRKGRIRFKSGGELHLLPSARERTTRNAFAWLDHHADKVKTSFEDDLAGYLLIAWDSSGGYTARARCYTDNPCMNTLPEWAAEAVRRLNSAEDVEHRLDLPRDE
jgi:hypothetical protein